jgi:hypothetical protein
MPFFTWFLLVIQHLLKWAHIIKIYQEQIIIKNNSDKLK